MAKETKVIHVHLIFKKNKPFFWFYISNLF